MADNLPLVPDSRNLCNDVRSVLREVFREVDYLPPLKAVKDLKKQKSEDDWVENFTKECNEIWQREDALKQEYAKRLSKKPAPNIYQLHSERTTGIEDEWRAQRGIIERRSLLPTIAQNSGRDKSLWVQNIMNRSSGDVTSVDVASRARSSEQSLVEGKSMLSFSIGEVPPKMFSPPPSIPRFETEPEYIICVPSKLDFINFTIGQLHTQTVRLINVSKFEIRLSLRPPSRRELNLEISGARGLTVTSGSAAEVRVHFRPLNVLSIRDEMLVRASSGKDRLVAIHCYMEPPLLNVFVPSISGCARFPSPRGEDVLELGSCLLGDVHRVPIFLHSKADHAAFFFITEDAWLTLNLEGITSRGCLQAGAFTIWPCWFAGGGAVPGCVWCSAECAGFHVASLRVLCSTAVVRPLNLLADFVMFSPKHITIEAQEKDYDICSEDDASCEYYVHLGTAFPNRSLSASVQLVNHSSLLYSYYWTTRPWGKCFCYEKTTNEMEEGDSEIEEFQCGSKCTNLDEQQMVDREDPFRLVEVDPSKGRSAPRSTTEVIVSAEDVGSELGVQRAVMMLILRNIPKKSFSEEYDPMITDVKIIKPQTAPGVESPPVEVCDVVCCQLEIWWEVVPVRFVLDPPLIPIVHSRRVKNVELNIQAVQLYGTDAVQCHWAAPGQALAPESTKLTSFQSKAVNVNLPLLSSIDERVEMDVISLTAAKEEWRSDCLVTRQALTRPLLLRPAAVWLGVVPPGTTLTTKLEISNSTFQQINWSATAYQSCGEEYSSRSCVGRPPCVVCKQRACSCTVLMPSRGSLEHTERTEIQFHVTAPDRDGCVMALVFVKRTNSSLEYAADVSASLISYRVLAPRLVIRVLPCAGDKKRECEYCDLDEGDSNNPRGALILRPKQALPLGVRACYKLRIVNTTPILTDLKWEPSLNLDDAVKITFIPREVSIGSYETKDISILLEASKVCDRSLYVCSSSVTHAHTKIYLLIDAAVSGLEVVCEIPVGDGEAIDRAEIKLMQKEVPWVGAKQEMNFEGKFLENDRLKEARAKGSVCRCHYELKYIPPMKPLRPPSEEKSVEIVCEPPLLTRVCKCFETTKPVLPECSEALCLQYKNLPIKKVRTKTLVFSNKSTQRLQCKSIVRRWPLKRRRTISSDVWSSGVRECGVGVLCSQTPAGDAVCVDVSVYADCWGLYRDQILIQIENLDPLIFDIFIEVVGPPLQFALKPNYSNCEDSPPILWMTQADSERSLLVKNTSRCGLSVQAFVLTEHEHHQDYLPFRLYLRFLDSFPPTCPCAVFENSIDESSTCSLSSTGLATEFELFLGPDHGKQDNYNFKITPDTLSISARTEAKWQVKLEAVHQEPAPAARVMFRCIPLSRSGECWYRPDPPPQIVRLKEAPREGVLEVSCSKVVVSVCALNLPEENVLRCRKRFDVRNPGSGPLQLTARTREPWCVVTESARAHCGTGCGCDPKFERTRDEAVTMSLPARCCVEMCVEVYIKTDDVWPPQPQDREEQLNETPLPELQTISTPLTFCDAVNELLSIPLILEIEYPALRMKPDTIDFGFVTERDTRKTYFTITHTSRKETLDVTTEWLGGDEVRVWPRTVCVAPRTGCRVYVQYTARWCGSPLEGAVRVRAGARCGGGVRVRARPTRDHKCRMLPHDFTDDANLLPPHLPY
uniref:Uncharacterized protein n=1 Tax=Bombyx mori TaxID=7091 RepID=A0A8R2QYL2_BOMMO|nr:uncharacterized protein LOC105841511 isoform X2 [Bombyx mori]